MLRALAGGLWSMGGRLWNFWLHLVLKNQIVTTALVFSASTVVFSLATLLLFWFGYVVLVPNDLILPLHLDYGTTMTTSATTSTTGELQLHQQSAAACCASFGILDQKEEWRDQEFAQEPNYTSTVDRDFYSDGFEKAIFTTSSSSFLRFIAGRSLSKAKSIFGLKLVASVPSLPSAREYNNQLGPVSLQLSKKNQKSSSIVLARRSFFAPAIDEGVVEQFFWRPLRKIVSRILHAEEEAVDFQIPLTENLSLKTVGPSDRLQLCLSPPVRMEQVYLVVEAELSGLRKWIRGYPYLFMFLALILSAITGFVTTAFLFVLSSIMASADDEEEEGTMPWVGGEDDHDEREDLERVGDPGEELGGDHRDRSPGGLSTLGVGGGSSRRRRRSSDLVSSSGGEQEHEDQQDE